MDADDWYDAYRECGGIAWGPIDPYYSHQADLMIAEMRRRRPVLSAESFAVLARRRFAGETLTDAEIEAMDQAEAYSRNGGA